MQRYRDFIKDYESGMDRAALSSKYGIAESDFDAFLRFLKRKGLAASPPAPKGFASFADQIDYEIFGDDMQFVEIELDPGETAIAEAGAMMFIEQGIEMETIFGDGSAEHQGVMDRIFGAGKRVLAGESLFMTAYTNRGAGKQKAAFAAPYPGKIVPLKLSEFPGGTLICQKDAFLAAAKGVSVGIEFQKRLGVGFFGGEGFILERLRGDGYVFLHSGGTVVERTLAPGETLRVDTGCLVAMEGGVRYDIEFVGSIKTAVFGGEGIFFATVTGPGSVWLQSLPMSRLADRIMASAPRSGGRQVGEGSVIGGLGRLFE